MNKAIVKSFSFPEGDIRGDMFYIKHCNGTFTIIDCYLKKETEINGRQSEILTEIKSLSKCCDVQRFISTHPDQDHIEGLEILNREWPIQNFYSVPNNKKAEHGNSSLDEYIRLRKSTSNYIIKQDVERYWLNQSNSERNSIGINFLWPDLKNAKFIAAQKSVEQGGSPNNISPVFTYSVKNSATIMWMGDMLSDMQKEFYEQCWQKLSKIDILFHPHHGRDTSKIPSELLDILDPSLIIIGNAPAKDLNYSNSCKTITQNTAGDILLVIEEKKVHVYTQNKIDNKPDTLICDYEYAMCNLEYLNCKYLGTLKLI